MKNNFLVLSMALSILLVGCSTTTLTPEQSFALQQAQTKQFEVPYSVVWASTLSFLQDNYYNIGSVSKESLFLGASKIKSKKDPSNELYWADIKKNDYIVLNCSFDPIDDSSTTVRINITTTRDKGNIGFSYGGVISSKSKKDVTPITDPATYKAFMDNLNRAVQRRWMAQKMRDESKTKSDVLSH